MKIFKNIKNLEVYKFGLISPVVHGRPEKQNKYFRKLSEEGVEIPPGSGNVYYLKPTTFKSWLREFKIQGLEGLMAKVRSDKGKYRKITPVVLKAIDTWGRSLEVHCQEGRLIFFIFRLSRGEKFFAPSIGPIFARTDTPRPFGQINACGENHSLQQFSFYHEGHEGHEGETKFSSCSSCPSWFKF